MAISIDREKQPIPCITPESKHWTARITVCEDIPIMHCSTWSKLKRYIFCDPEGNHTLACIYDPDLDTLGPMIHLYAVYDISNADVRRTNQQYQIINHPFHWIIKRETLIQPAPQATPTLHYMLAGLTPLIDLPNVAKTNKTTADVIAIVIDCDDIRQVKSGRNQVQHFTIIDSDLFPVRITLWDDNIATHSPTLTEAANNKSVIIAKRMALKTYDSLSLSTRNSSSIAVDPPLRHTVAEMKEWFSTIDPLHLENMKTQKTTSFTKELVCAGRMKTYQVADLKNIEKIGSYWVRGYLRLLHDDQQFYYIASNKCLKKVKATIDHDYNCFLCKQDAKAIIRPVVVLCIIDQSGDMELTALHKTAEKILHTTIDDMKDLHNSGKPLDLGPAKEDLKSKPFLLHLTKTAASLTDKNLRMVLQAYYDENAPLLEHRPSSSTSDLPLSPLKRQLDAITITKETPVKKKPIPANLPQKIPQVRGNDNNA